MANVDEVQRRTYCADPQFQRYLGTCEDFDPVGIERALNADEKSGSFVPEGITVPVRNCYAFRSQRNGNALRPMHFSRGRTQNSRSRNSSL